MLTSMRQWLPHQPARHGSQPPAPHEPTLWPQPRLQLLSFNMQAGMGIHAPHHYLTRGHRHILPHKTRHQHLDAIAHLLRPYDVVALQEVDGGSLRSGYTHQLLHLAQAAGFGWWYQQLNRDLGHFGQFSNGLLSRQPPCAVEAHALPGLRGRGLILSRFGTGDSELVLLNVHLALSARARAPQLAFIQQLTQQAPHVIIMGDLNCSSDELRHSALGRRHWHWPSQALHTYPSWRPVRQIDHILVSASLAAPATRVLETRLSDHRPLATELILPPGLYRPAAC